MKPTPSESKPAGGKRRVFSRRNFIKAFAGTLLAAGGTYAYGAGFEVHHLVVEDLTLPIPGLAARWHNKRLALISDLHAGRTDMAHLRRSFQMACELRPEFLLVTGDWVDNSTVDPRELAATVRPFAGRVPIVGITGNHDFGRGFSDKVFAERVCGALTDAGVRMLRNGVYQPHAGPGELCFVGIDDFWSGLFEPEALRGAPGDASVILLSHNPDTYEHVAPYRFHVMLSGHTHGGQVCLPFHGPIIRHVEHRERMAGLFHLTPAEPMRALYVNRGVGHNYRIRLLCPPEITCITLRNPAMV